ncbi:hypothetical protein AB1L88_21615 [Tautonia sp. JC769]|uniref:hypothetical protein n=1 Tax=Tautonia sp. JC769 TaxID=3232135 RepID=UPI003458D6FA
MHPALIALLCVVGLALVGLLTAEGLALAFGRTGPARSLFEARRAGPPVAEIAPDEPVVVPASKALEKLDPRLCPYVPTLEYDADRNLTVLWLELGTPLASSGPGWESGFAEDVHLGLVAWATGDDPRNLSPVSSYLLVSRSDGPFQSPSEIEVFTGHDSIYRLEHIPPKYFHDARTPFNYREVDAFSMREGPLKSVGIAEELVLFIEGRAYSLTRAQQEGVMCFFDAVCFEDRREDALRGDSALARMNRDARFTNAIHSWMKLRSEQTP